MRDGGCELNVTHALTTDLLACHLNAALFADMKLFVANALILSAGARSVLGRTEDTLAEKTVALGLESSVIDGLGLCYLSVRPVKYHLRRSKTDLYRIKRVVFR